MKAHHFKVGQKVKLRQVPPQVERDQARFPETFAIFQKSLGRVFRIRGLDEHGHVELWLREDGSEDNSGAAHSIWVETEYLTLSKTSR